MSWAVLKLVSSRGRDWTVAGPEFAGIYVSAVTRRESRSSSAFPLHTDSDKLDDDLDVRDNGRDNERGGVSRLLMGTHR